MCVTFNSSEHTSHCPHQPSHITALLIEQLSEVVVKACVSF